MDFLMTRMYPSPPASSLRPITPPPIGRTDGREHPSAFSWRFFHRDTEVCGNPAFATGLLCGFDHLAAPAIGSPVREPDWAGRDLSVSSLSCHTAGVAGAL